jgi:hypothetical protein
MQTANSVVNTTNSGIETANGGGKFSYQKWKEINSYLLVLNAIHYVFDEHFCLSVP